MQTFDIIAFFRMKKVLVYNLDALLRTVIHCLITNALIAFFILIYSGTSHFHLFFTSTLCVDLIVLQILKDINVKHYSREKGLKMGPDNITVWNPIEQVLHDFFQLKFIQVVFWQKNKKERNEAVLLDFVQMRGGGPCPNLLSTFHKLYILGQFGDGEGGGDHCPNFLAHCVKKKWYKRQKISLLIVNIFRLLNSMIYWSRWSVDLR